jgi:uncharacterized protein (DUF427 family)
MSLLERSDRLTYRPCKGDASYCDIVAGAARPFNAVWTRDSPLSFALAITDYPPLNPQRVGNVTESRECSCEPESRCSTFRR